jgi:hypothetical protein
VNHYLSLLENAEVDLVHQACLYIYFSDAAPTKSALGVINGLGQTVACSVRKFAPLLASSLFSVTHQHNLLGGTMVYWILWVFVITGMGCTRRVIFQNISSRKQNSKDLKPLCPCLLEYISLGYDYGTRYTEHGTFDSVRSMSVVSLFCFCICLLCFLALSPCVSKFSL